MVLVIGNLITSKKNNYLGVVLNKKLLFSTHIRRTVLKNKAALRKIIPNSGATSSLKRMALFGVIYFEMSLAWVVCSFGDEIIQRYDCSTVNMQLLLCMMRYIG